jgi:histidyl-tRNA synthetase
LAIRPENTPGVVRAYIQHGLVNQPQPVKMYYVGPMFRHEKPQSGRFRQFFQVGFEAIGEAGPTMDAQLILIGYNILNDLGLDAVIQVNSIGCTTCREDYKKALLKYYKQHTKSLCENCLSRLVKNPLRLLDCKEPSCQAIKDEAPQILDFLDEDCKKHFMKVLEYLDELNLPYVLNPRIVRGLDYYNRTVVEYWSADDLEGKNALGGGGRYDGLVSLMGGREDTPACGWALGLDRIVAKIREKELPLEEVYQPDVFIAQLGESAKKKAIVLYESLRHKFKMSQALYKDSLKAQLEAANRLKVKYTLILGQKEITDGTVMLRDMNGSVQEIINLNKIESELKRRLEKYTGDEGVAVIDTDETRAALSSSKRRSDYVDRSAEDSSNEFADFSSPAEGKVSDDSADVSGDE